MNTLYLQVCLSLFVPLIFCLLTIPGVIRGSIKMGLVDIPNYRKVHKVPVPRFGGVAIFFSALSGIALNTTGWQALRTWPVFFTSLGILFFVGVWDDCKDISARLRFLIQVACAIAVAATGIRLTSLFGILGIGQLNTISQYAITVVVIVGTTNAFNLIDGVDGLAGGLAVIGMAVLSIISWQLKDYPMAMVMVAFGGALLGFLKNNISPAKIFMGDGGSLVLGFLMSVSGIILIEKAHDAPALFAPSRVASLITAILVIPVFDSLRVFAYRIKKGISPFKADKTHIHHLFLIAGLNHKKTTLVLCSFELLLVALSVLLAGSTGVSIIIFAMVLSFHIITEILRVNQSMEKWLAVIKRMEHE